MMSATFGKSTIALDVAQHYKEHAHGKTMIVTGGYSGIGVETVKALLSVGAKVIVAGRNASLLDAFVAEMKGLSEDVDGMVLDLGDLSSVKAFAAAFKGKYSTLDVLINNAGVMNTPQGMTVQSQETQFGVNVVGHWLLTRLLVDMLEASPDGRVVFVSSIGHSLYGAKRFDHEYYKSYSMESEYHGWRQYQQSKLGNILLAREFNKRFGIKGISLHPGGINTNLMRTTTLFSALGFLFSNLGTILSSGEFMKSAPQGASTTIVGALSPDLAGGEYLHDCQVSEANANASFEEDWALCYDFCDTVSKDFQ